MADFVFGLEPNAKLKIGLGDQVRAFEQEARRLSRATLRAGGRRFRERMVQERLSAPRPSWMERKARRGIPSTAPLSKKTGALVRSLRYKLDQGGADITLQAKIGGGQAYYADKHEDSGRLQFQRIFALEARKTEDELRLGFEALGRLGSSRLPSAMADLPSAGDSGQGGRFSELGARSEAKKARAKENRLMRRVDKLRPIASRISGGIR